MNKFDDYFTLYRNELISLGLAALAIIVLFILFLYFIIKLTKKYKTRVENSRTMKIPSQIKLKNSFIRFVFSIFGVIGMVFCIYMLLYMVKPEQFSLNNITTSTVALYSLMAVYIFLLLKFLIIVLNFLTTRVEIDNETIHIRYYLLRNYFVIKSDVLAFERIRGRDRTSPIAGFWFTDIEGKKHKLYLYLSEESYIILSRYIYDEE
ncbi:MAG: hypothetical protein RR623_07885 [Bacilli bacterium]